VALLLAHHLPMVDCFGDEAQAHPCLLYNSSSKGAFIELWVKLGIFHATLSSSLL